MRFVFFYQSLVSDWNNGTAHFLRGVVKELTRLGHDVKVYEPRKGWSFSNLIRREGYDRVREFRKMFPTLKSTRYDWHTIDLDSALEGADVVIAHEWNEPAFIEKLSKHRKLSGKYLLFFHDTHHRSFSAPEQMQQFELSGFDGVLVFGAALQDIYRRRGWATDIFVWHEAADAELFRPIPVVQRSGMVWIGNWREDERAEEIEEFLIRPVESLGLKTIVYGVHYPDEVRERLSRAPFSHGGWIPNFLIPSIFARHALTVHVPRRFHARHLPGIPTTRVFEALAAGIPLVCGPWTDSENLFRPGRDFLIARTGEEMREIMWQVSQDPGFASFLMKSGRETVLSRHTCRHRARELLNICAGLGRNGEEESKVYWTTPNAFYSGGV